MLSTWSRSGKSLFRSDQWRPAEFTQDDHKGMVQKTPDIHILDERGDGAIKPGK
jgi:hypothetical protein